jgi:hypothetical protein
MDLAEARSLMHEASEETGPLEAVRVLEKALSLFQVGACEA